MPSVSEAQRRAMQAAKHGESTIGIPRSVGAKFVAADKVKRSRGPFKLPHHKGKSKR